MRKRIRLVVDIVHKRRNRRAIGNRTGIYMQRRGTLRKPLNRIIGGIQDFRDVMNAGVFRPLLLFRPKRGGDRLVVV